MTDLHYLFVIKKSLEKEADTMHLLDAAEIRIDLGELKYILSFVSKIEQFVTMNTQRDTFLSQAQLPSIKKFYNCYLCGNLTVLYRPEQHVMLNNNCIKVKCLDCLITLLQNTRQKTEQLFAYEKFVGDNNLEEAFEYFWQECLIKGDLE